MLGFPNKAFHELNNRKIMAEDKYKYCSLVVDEMSTKNASLGTRQGELFCYIDKGNGTS